MAEQKLGAQIAEGKTKQVYAHPDNADLAILVHKDGITAGDGARRNVILGKGALAGRTTANVFRLLNQEGIPTHFVDSPEATITIVRRCEMLPLEVVRRRIATGSYLKRNTEVKEGTRFTPTVIEFFLKDDAQHDPLISQAEIVAQGIASQAELNEMISQSERVFEVIEQAWAAQVVSLVDLKIEFGRALNADGSTSLIVADVIDNDSWRIWPGGEKGRMLDKQVYRNAQAVDANVLDDVRRRYETVAELTEAFVQR